MLNKHATKHITVGGWKRIKKKEEDAPAIHAKQTREIFI